MSRNVDAAVTCLLSLGPSQLCPAVHVMTWIKAGLDRSKRCVEKGRKTPNGQRGLHQRTDACSCSPVVQQHRNGLHLAPGKSRVEDLTSCCVQCIEGTLVRRAMASLQQASRGVACRSPSVFRCLAPRLSFVVPRVGVRRGLILKTHGSEHKLQNSCVRPRC